MEQLVQWCSRLDAAIPQDVCDGASVIVTFLPANFIDLQATGINEQQAADLCARLATIAEDLESPEMGVYDNYDVA